MTWLQFIVGEHVIATLGALTTLANTLLLLAQDRRSARRHLEYSAAHEEMAQRIVAHTSTPQSPG